MKRIFTIATVCFSLIAVVCQAQIPPQFFNYSAVARDATGIPIVNTTIGIQTSIRQTSSVGSVIYQENHVVLTDQFGLFNLIIGAGDIQNGSMAAITWSSDNYYLEVGMDVNGGTSFLTMGTTQLLSVPYALHASTADSVIGQTDNTIYIQAGNNVTITGTGTAANPYIVNAVNEITVAPSSFVLPSITTNAVSNITISSATYGGSVTIPLGNEIIEHGVVVSTDPYPTVNDIRIEIGFGNGNFDTTMSSNGYASDLNLLSNTTYYVRAYAITDNNIITYGNEVSFISLPMGETGPGGGLIFYDKGNNDGGWRYLEAAPMDQSSGITWGCAGSIIGNTSILIGSGQTNTSFIVAGCNEASFAAKICDELNLGGQNDWFLPSEIELVLMRNCLLVNGLGNFSTGGYWSSSESGSQSANKINFNATGGSNTKGTLYFVRAIRAF